MRDRVVARSSIIEIVVYRITGRQGIIDIPHRYCEECDLTIAVARQVLQQLDDRAVRLTVKPWMLYFWRPIWRGGWHAPILTINGKVYSQGVVPAFDGLLRAVERELSASRNGAAAQRTS